MLVARSCKHCVRWVGTLHVVATPIGNLRDISPRAASVLQSVPVIACEDTRVTSKLHAHLTEGGRAAPARFVSCNEHNERARTASIIASLQAGQDVALVSDAGTPCVSDPGAVVIDAVHTAGLRVTPLPGPCAAVAAVSASGLNSVNGVCILGFLSTAAAQLVVLFEAPVRVRDTLALLNRALEHDGATSMRVCIAREMTKLHESIRVHASIAEAARQEALRPPRGEYVIVLEPPAAAPAAAADEHVDAAPLSEAIDLMRMLQRTHTSLRTAAAVRIVSDVTGVARKQLYDAVAMERATQDRQGE